MPLLIGQKIQSAREEKKMSQEQLANAIGCSQAALSNYEKGKRRIYLSQLEVLAKVLDKPIDYFWETSEPQRTAQPRVAVENNNLVLRIVENLYYLDDKQLDDVHEFVQFLIWKERNEDGKLPR